MLTIDPDIKKHVSAIEVLIKELITDKAVADALIHIEWVARRMRKLEKEVKDAAYNDMEDASSQHDQKTVPDMISDTT